jgi:entericidin B
MKLTIRLAMLAAAASLLVACNTAEGVGKDIKAGGKAVEKTAKDVKKKL